MFNLKNAVIARTPRNKPVLVFGVLWGFSLLIVIFCYFLVIPELSLFNGVDPAVRCQSLSVRFLGGLFFIFLAIAVSVAAIRNNTKSQPVEAIIVILGLLVAVLFFFFGTPLLFLWAHLHGYHVDHYEAARRGGWYIFKLNSNST